MMYVVNAYFWIAAIGFPLALPFALLKRRDMQKEYYTGWDNGYDAGCCGHGSHVLASRAVTPDTKHTKESK